MTKFGGTTFITWSHERLDGLGTACATLYQKLQRRPSFTSLELTATVPFDATMARQARNLGIKANV